MIKEKKITETIGLAPGTLVHVGEEPLRPVTITLIEYDKDNYRQKEIKSIDECFPISDTSMKKWINVTGVHNLEIIESIGKHLNLHPLILEDIVNTEQRPRIEDFEDYLYVTLKMLTYDEKDEEIDLEKLSIILGKNYVITFEEKAANVLDIIVNRLKSGNTKARIRKSDYLAYSLLDVVVDNYFALLDKLNQLIEHLEDDLVENPTSEVLMDIYELKRELLFLRKSVLPLREIIGSLCRVKTSLIEESTLFYLEDVYDHVRQIMDTVDIYKETISSMMDTYLSSISIKLNDVMKLLTIFASIFIPLTFITGVYGMNFSHMPELDWNFGYYITWIFMLLISVGMLVYFRKKKWF
ncbi:magnesium/cobalt transporter CorA [bacterium]|nr:magnesium/cobalt transporter CorA [bacterium]MBU1024495.1 magnesium/cobalt transporter CorA [bacterium]